MNTIRSVGYGWGVLIVAGGGAYYFAKKDISRDREVRSAANRQNLAMQAQLRAQEYDMPSRQSSKISTPSSDSADNASAPSREMADPAPTRHAPETEGQRVGEKSKFEAAEVWRSRKGDRFS